MNKGEEIKSVNEIFRTNLRILRANQEMSGEKLAFEVGLPTKRINDLEGGRMPPNLEDLIKLTKHFNITFDDLLSSKIELSIKSEYKNKIDWSEALGSY